MTTLYGIKNCDTVRKTRKWLDKHGVNYEFHDVRNDGLSNTQLRHWIKQAGWETLLNRRGTTWRQLAEKDKMDMTETKALKLLLAHPAMIKRPVLEYRKKCYVGFSEAEYTQLFK